jgi:hypothetical protein
MMGILCPGEAGAQKTMYITRLAAWAPGMETGEEWREWARGSREISMSRESPGIEFTDPLFRRRLSQISKMTIRVIHDLLKPGEDIKIVFLSFRGELARQYEINKMLIEENSLMPAAFSLSVFNAPPALAAMALRLEAGYTALYPGQDSFDAGLAAAAAAALCGSGEKILLVYADEMPIPEYLRLSTGKCEPLAFGVLLSREPGTESIPLGEIDRAGSPAAFLKSLILHRQLPAAFGKENT